MNNKLINIKIKPLSINEAWQGKRFKTNKYNTYETELLLLLPKFKLPKEPYELNIVFGLSSKLADVDNPVKCLIDILQKKYNFNDKLIFKLLVIKQLTKKGDEFIKFNILNYSSDK